MYYDICTIDTRVDIAIAIRITIGDSLLLVTILPVIRMMFPLAITMHMTSNHNSPNTTTITRTILSDMGIAIAIDIAITSMTVISTRLRAAHINVIVRQATHIVVIIRTRIRNNSSRVIIYIAVAHTNTSHAIHCY